MFFDSRSDSKKKNLFACMVIFTTIGYQTLGPLFGVITQSSIASIIFRALVVMLCAFLMLYQPSKSRKYWVILSFGFIFALLYTGRLVEDYFLDSSAPVIPVLQVFGIHLGTGLVPAIILSRYPGLLDDDAFARVGIIAAILFILGVILNFELLQADVQRARLDRLGPIGLSKNSLILIIFFLLFFRAYSPIKWMALFAVPFLLYCVVVANSRGPLVGVAITGIMMILLSSSRDRVTKIGGSILLVLVTMVVGWILKIPIFSALTSRMMNESGVTVGRSGDLRLKIWEISWNQFLDNPLLGVDIHQPFGGTVHNSVIEVFMATGLVGAIFFFIHIGITLRYCRHIMVNNRSIAGDFIIAMFFMSFVGSFFSGALYGITGFWVLSFLIISLGATQATSNRGSRYGKRLTLYPRI